MGILVAKASRDARDNGATTVVCKFGGTSVGSGERIANVARIVTDLRADMGHPPAVVVSAMSGVTDSLIQGAMSAAHGDRETFAVIRHALEAKHREATVACVDDAAEQAQLLAEQSELLDWFETLCASIATLGELTPRGLDAVSGLGERLSARVAAAALRSLGTPAEAIEATEIIVTNGGFGAAVPLWEETTARVRERLLPLLEQGIVPVVTGFIAATREGIPTTLGRGGSDYTGSVLGRCLPADEVWIWTDVSGVMTADPRIVPNAATLPSITYGEVSELAFFGAKVLHPKTIQPVADIGIPVRVLNTFEPHKRGTLVCETPDESHLVKGITAIRDLSIVAIQGRGMMGVPGIAGRAFTAVAHAGVSILMITQSSSEQSICFAIRRADAPQVVAALEKEFQLEMMRQDVDRISAQHEVAIVAVVGAGMLGRPGIASEVFGALAERGINIISIAQGSSEYNLSLVVAQGDADDAVRAIHDRFGLGE